MINHLSLLDAQKDCHDLATVANVVEGLNSQVRSAIRGIAESFAHHLGLPKIAVTVIGEVAGRTPLPGHRPITETVRAIRIVGVFLCVANDDLHALEHCECLRDLANMLGPDAIGNVLRGGL